MKRDNSERLFAEAQKYLPGGVSSPVRAFKAVGANPLFITRGHGARLTDADGNELIDYVCSWGPLILGHCHHEVISALRDALERGTSFGAPTELELELARMISDAIPSIEMMRFVSSGTEAAMSAIRLARAFTGRDKMIKFAGCYHGHSDGLLARAGSGIATLGIADSPGVPSSYAEHTLVLPYNDIQAVEQVFERRAGEIAAVIVEPVAGNMGVVLPGPGFLEDLRRLTARAGSLLIFDEVITGFRLGYGGFQNSCGIPPDLTCLGKVIGGGLPIGAYGGRRDVIEMVSPSGPVYQAGTLSGNPLATTAGIQTLRILGRPGTYEHLEASASHLADGILTAATDTGLRVRLNRVGSMLTVFFTPEPVTDYDSARQSDLSMYGRVFRHLLARGVYWPPAQFEATFVSTAHDADDIDLTVAAFQEAFRSLVSG